MRLVVTALALSLATACGIDPAKIPATHVYGSDAALVEAGEVTSFAVVGATRTPLTGRGEPPVPVETIADLSREARARGLQFAVLTGNHVSRSTTGEWAAFAERWSPALRGEVVADGEARLRAVPLRGVGEAFGDRKLDGYAAAFPDAGADIGYGRTASWSHLDLAVGGATWRLVFVDTNKKALGARWSEQLAWLAEVVSGSDFDRLLVFQSDPLVTVAKGAPMDRQDAPSELLAVVDAHSDLMKLVGVFSGGAGSNEALLPDGAMSELHVVAGNGGIPAADLRYEADAADAGLETVALEPAFAGALDARFERWAGAQAIDAAVVEESRAAEPPVLPGKSFPVQGWWTVTLKGEALGVRFRMRQHDGAYEDTWRAVWTPKAGWKTEGML